MGRTLQIKLANKTTVGERLTRLKFATRGLHNLKFRCSCLYSRMRQWDFRIFWILNDASMEILGLCRKII